MDDPEVYDSAVLGRMGEEELQEWAKSLKSVETKKADPSAREEKLCTAIVHMHRPEDHVDRYMNFRNMLTSQNAEVMKTGWNVPIYARKADRSPEYSHKLIYYALLSMDITITLMQPLETRFNWRQHCLSDRAFEDVEVALVELSDLLIKLNIDDAEKMSRAKREWNEVSSVRSETDVLDV